jgi:hypothetical protein
MRVHFGASAVSVGAGSDFVAMAAKVLTELSAIITAFNAHTHPAPGGATSPPMPMTSAGSVASVDLKAD